MLLHLKKTASFSKKEAALLLVLNGMKRIVFQNLNCLVVKLCNTLGRYKVIFEKTIIGMTACGQNIILS